MWARSCDESCGTEPEVATHDRCALTVNMTHMPFDLPPGVQVFERGWLSANNILFLGQTHALVDSGYATHADQTLSLVNRALADRPLQLLINTHLHSDHCGGNAALQQQHPGLRTLIPPGQAHLVRDWDPVGLTYTPTGQMCERFTIDGVLQPGSVVQLGDLRWDVHAAPGHDPHSVILFQPDFRVLISADALWERGFGVVFPELDGLHAYDEVAATLDLIEALNPVTVIPGHGGLFSEVSASLAYARKRLEGFVQNPRKHALHAAKVLLKFKLLEWQRVPQAQFVQWASLTSHIANTHRTHFSEQSLTAWLDQLVSELVRSGAAAQAGDMLLNA